MTIKSQTDIIFAHNEFTDDAIEDYKEYIATQVLADSVKIGEIAAPKEDEKLEIDEIKVDVNINLHK